MEDVKNGNFWQKANQLYELRAQQLQAFRQHLDNYAANVEKSGDSQAAELLEQARNYINNEYQLQYGFNIYLADFFMEKK